MISKKACFCQLTEHRVEAIVEELVKGRGKARETIATILDCTASTKCSKSSFCRFVNPLTTRNPLEILDEAAPLPAG